MEQQIWSNKYINVTDIAGLINKNKYQNQLDCINKCKNRWFNEKNIILSEIVYKKTITFLKSKSIDLSADKYDDPNKYFNTILTKINIKEIITQTYRIEEENIQDQIDIEQAVIDPEIKSQIDPEVINEENVQDQIDIDPDPEIIEEENVEVIDQEIIDQEIIEEIKSQINSYYGIQKEDDAILFIIEENSGTVSDKQKYFKKTMLYDNDIIIGGKIDGIFIDEHKNRYILEIKNRVNKFYDILSEYEKIQIQFYMYMSGIYKTMLVQHCNGSYIKTIYEFDIEYIKSIENELSVVIDIIEGNDNIEINDLIPIDNIQPSKIDKKIPEIISLVVYDFETNDSNFRHDSIIQIGATQILWNTVDNIQIGTSKEFNIFIKPKILSFNPWVQCKLKISLDMLKTQPSFRECCIEYFNWIIKVSEQYPVVMLGYNSKTFDFNFLLNEMQNSKLSISWFEKINLYGLFDLLAWLRNNKIISLKGTLFPKTDNDNTGYSLGNLFKTIFPDHILMHHNALDDSIMTKMLLIGTLNENNVFNSIDSLFDRINYFNELLVRPTNSEMRPYLHNKRKEYIIPALTINPIKIGKIVSLIIFQVGTSGSNFRDDNITQINSYCAFWDVNNNNLLKLAGTYSNNNLLKYFNWIIKTSNGYPVIMVEHNHISLNINFLLSAMTSQELSVNDWFKKINLIDILNTYNILKSKKIKSINKTILPITDKNNVSYSLDNLYKTLYPNDKSIYSCYKIKSIVDLLINDKIFFINNTDKNIKNVIAKYNKLLLTPNKSDKSNYTQLLLEQKNK
jgi:hypothetical protein